MKTVNMHDAKTNLSRLVDEASKGAPFVIARAGKPLVKVIALDAEPAKRTGFLEGQISVPADFDEMATETIQEMFEGQGG